MLAYVEARALLDRNDIPANIERAIDRCNTRSRPTRIVRARATPRWGSRC
jgi:hypothetical protein